MGIPGFFGQFVESRKFEGVTGNFLSSSNVSGLYFDGNGLLYPVIEAEIKILEDKKITDKDVILDHILQAILAKFSQVISSFLIVDTVMFAFDGLVPKAKMEQQRQRRYGRSAEPDLPLSKGKGKKVSRKKPLFDITQISPGTDFMWIRDNRHLLPPEVIYSSYKVAGEAEHKIANTLRDVSRFPKSTNYDGQHIIYGLDADLILISLLLPLKKIVLFREDLRMESKGRKTYVFIEKLYKEIGKLIPINDFVFLMSLIGNDFIPRIFSFAYDIEKSINTIINQYKARTFNLIDPYTSNINYKDLSEILKSLISFEKENLTLLAHISDTKTRIEDFRRPIEIFTLKSGDDNSKVYDGQKLDYELFGEFWYSSEFNFRIPDVDAELGILESITIDDSDINSMAIDFIRGMIWTYTYYTKGYAAINKNWSYAYTRAPLISSLASVSGVKKPNFDGYLSNKKEEVSLSMIHQLAYIIPKTSKSILPGGLSKIFNEGSQYADIFPVHYRFEKIGEFQNEKRKPLFEHLHIGNADPLRLHFAVLSVVDNIDETYAPQLRLSSSDEKLFIATPQQLRLYQNTLREKSEKIAIARLENERERRTGYGAPTATVRGGRGRGRGISQSRESPKSVTSTESNKTPIQISEPSELSEPSSYRGRGRATQASEPSSYRGRGRATYQASESNEPSGFRGRGRATYQPRESGEPSSYRGRGRATYQPRESGEPSSYRGRGRGISQPSETVAPTSKSTTSTGRGVYVPKSIRESQPSFKSKSKTLDVGRANLF